MRDLLSEYLAESEDVMPFFAHRPSALFEALPRPSPWPSAVVREMRLYNEQMGSSASFDGTELTVVTGQQPALFVGPMYTVYKALTAIKLAEAIEKHTATRCVPVFWVASEDHDFDEAATAHFLTKKDEPYSLTYAPDADVSGMPMYRVPLERWIHEAIDRAAHETRKSEHSKEIAGFLHESAESSSSLCDWSVRLLARMFRETPLTLFAPHLPAARDVQASIVRKEIAHPTESVRRINATGKALERLGLRPQIEKEDDECSFFLEVDGRRRKVLFREDVFYMPEVHMSLSMKEMRSLLESEPERFSANVALRPVVQQRLFKAAAYVGGPSEVAYWAQLKDIFARFNEPMPVVVPRAQCVLAHTKLKKLMEKLALSVEDLSMPLAQLEEKALRSGSQTILYEEITRLREHIVDQFQAGVSAVETLDPVAGEMLDAVAGRVETEFGRIQSSMLRRDGERVETVRAQVRRLQHALMPWRKPQERVYTVFSFLFEHGWELIQRLLNEIDTESFQLNEVEL